MELNQARFEKRLRRAFLPAGILWTLLNCGVIYGLEGSLSTAGSWLYLLPWAAGLAGLIFSANRLQHFLILQEHARESLLESEAKFRNLVEMSPNAIIVHQNHKIIFINQSGLKMIGATNETQILGRPMLDLVHPEYRQVVAGRISEMLTSGQMAVPLEEKMVRLDGSVLEVEATATPLSFRGKQVVQVIWEDISQRKRLERALGSIEKGVSASIGQAFFESATSQLAQALESEVVFIGKYLPGLEMVRTLCVFQDGQIVPNFEYLLDGAPCENVINQQLCCYPSGVAAMFPEDAALKDWQVEGYLGMPLWDSEHNPTGVIVALYHRPIAAPDFAKSLVQIFAARVQVEMERTRILNDLLESRALLETVFNTLPYEVWASDAAGVCFLQNHVSQKYWGNTIGKLPKDLKNLPEETQKEWREKNLKVLAGEIVHEAKIAEIDGKRIHLDSTMAPILVGDRITGFVGVNIDMTERKRAEEQLLQSFERISALREIDQVILGGSEIHSVMDGVCRYAVALLRVEAVEILQLDLGTFTLEILARQGLEAYSLFSQFTASEDIASRAVLEQTIIHERNFAEYLKAFPSCSMLEIEHYRAYIAIPLIAKGVVRGVLEVFHRSDLNPENEWWELAQTLANQAAIAIDNLALFKDLQRSNTELSMAYDLTLEGWSKALELRDQETEGHTQRVTSLTLRLAEVLGVSRDKLVHFRRGALLHDIGKMGIPDQILHKPGQLVEAEWEIVKKHPQTAYELLLPIPFLHHALEIPYCHHERWDGTGYPRGLKGEEIPLAARIFSVIDVWDALTNDRPYRAAETPEKALEYLREQSGKYFDPEIVSAFEKLIRKQ